MHRIVALWSCWALIAASVQAAAETDRSDPLLQLRWLQGDWMGTGTGEPGTSATERHIACALGCKYLRIDGRSVYPRQEGNPKGEIHASMDMWSYDRARQQLVLRTFDTLGFTTTYVEDRSASNDHTLVLVAEHLENVPAGWKARYTYSFEPPNAYRELFELAPEGKDYATYVDNRFLRVETAD